MRARNAREVPHNVLQEYLESLADTAGHPDKRQQNVLLSYAELQYRLKGGGRCALCRTAVRHVLPVRAERADGSVSEFLCLCTRCLEGERATSERIIVTVGKAHLEYRAKHAAPKTQKFRALR